MPRRAIERAHRCADVQNRDIARPERTVERKFHPLERVECPKLYRAMANLRVGNVILAFECPSRPFECLIPGFEIAPRACKTVILSRDCLILVFDCPMGAFVPAILLFDCPTFLFDCPIPRHCRPRAVSGVPFRDGDSTCEPAKTAEAISSAPPNPAPAR